MTTTATATVYDQLHDLAAPLIESYLTDLEQWDKDTIEARTTGPFPTPFLHFTHRHGTHIVFLVAATEYPKAGEYVPYIFGTADREHILDGVACFVRHYSKEYHTTDAKLITYFNGKTLRVIDLGKAAEIVRDYQGSIRAQWKKGRD